MFEGYLTQFKLAITDEVKALRKSGGHKTFLSDGCYLGKRSQWYIYSFSTDSELRFPDDTLVDLEYRSKKYSGIIISTDGFDLILGLENYIGDSIATSILFTSPWFLLEELKKRLEEVQGLKGANVSLAQKMLGKTAKFLAINSSQTQKIVNTLEQQLGKPIEYNEEQRLALDTVLAREVSFIWGPPGTGKTKTLGMIVAALVQAGESVLVVAHSNAAVDVAMLSVARHLQGSPIYQNGLVLRYGASAQESLQQFPQLHVRGVVRKQNPALIAQIEQLEKHKKSLVQQSRTEKLTELQRQQLKSQIAQVKQQLQPLRDKLKEKEAELIGRATVVGCTLSKAAIAQEIYQRSFNAVVIDEASMAYIPHCAFVSTLAKRRVAVFGDFRQLGPISQADTEATQEWLQRDIFDEAGITSAVNKGLTDPRLVLLKTQYRMHPDISSVPNRLFYNNQLVDGARVQEQTTPIVHSQPHPGNTLVLYDLTKLSAFCFSEEQSHSRFNLISALLSVNLAYESVRAGNTSIGIITPYSAQSRLIHRILKDLHLSEKQVKVATVHRFQGSEQSLIIFDTVEGPPKTKAGVLVTGGMNSTAMRLANVAISRAQGKFIGLVNYSYLQEKLNSSNIFRKLIERVALQASIQSITWSQEEAKSVWNLQIPGMTYFPTSRAALTQIESDLVKAKEEIAIHWSTALAKYHFSASVLKKCNPDRVRFFITGEGYRDFAIGLQNTRIWDARSQINMSIVGIDRKCLWVYVNPASPTGAVLRLDLPQTTKLLYAFWHLIPDEEAKQETLLERVAQGKSPVGIPCPVCRGCLWPTVGKYGAYLACTNQNPKCSYTKPVTSADATNWARLSNNKCGKCSSQVKGCKSYKGVYLRCANTKCEGWTISLESLI